MANDRLSPTALRTSRTWWLVDLYFGGAPLRLAGDELDVTDSAGGVTYHYTSAFDDLDVAEGMSLLSDAAGQMEVPIDLLLPVDAAALCARGIPFDGSRIVISQWVEGTDWSARRVVLDGVVSDPQYGEDGEPLTFSAVDLSVEETILIPAATAIVNGVNWANVTSLHEEHLGIPYPIIIGKPGVVATDLQSEGRITGSTAVWVDYTNQLTLGQDTKDGLIAVIAGHHVQATRVVVASDTLTGGARMKVVNNYDLSGNPVAAIMWYASYSGGGYPDTAGIWEFDGTTTFVGDDTDSDSEVVSGLGSTTLNALLTADSNTDAADQTQFVIHISWYDEIAGGGGMIWRGALLRKAGDVIMWALSQGAAPVDYGRCAAQAPFLDRFLIDAAIEARVKPGEWLRDAILPLLPVSTVSGPDGRYYIVWRYNATTADAVQHLDMDADPDMEIVGGIQVEAGDCANDITLRYAYSARTGDHIATARISADAYDPDNKRFVPSQLCRVSQDMRRRARRTPIVELEVETDCIYDDGTALAILDWKVAALAMPKERCTAVAPLRTVSRLERGSVVTVTRAGLSLSSCVALVLDVRYIEDDGVELSLELRRWSTSDRWSV